MLTTGTQNVIPPSLAKKACQSSCTLGPLKAREVEADADDNADETFADVNFDAFASLGDDDASAGAALQAREPGITKGQVCRGACAVTCNSTVLALRQKWCLERCVSSFPISRHAHAHTLRQRHSTDAGCPIERQVP